MVWQVALAHYSEDQDVVLCFTCVQAHSKNKLTWSANVEAAFLSKGFANWKDATVKFEKHQTSKYHQEAVLKVVNIPATTQDIAESLSEQYRCEKLGYRWI